jgi:IS30 family transposase
MHGKTLSPYSTDRSLKLYELLFSGNAIASIANARKTPIREREEEVNKRFTLGHRESDSILFKHTKTNLFTLRKRKSRLIVAIKNTSRHAESTANTLIKYMRNNFSTRIATLTLDNDTAFAQHERIEAEMEAKIYFCEPYKSYQKGAIENANKLLRTKLPLKIDIDRFEQPEIDMIVKGFNDRPMKCLNYKTPHEALYETEGGYLF